MKPSHLAAQLVVWSACLAGFNAALQRASRNSIPRQIARDIDRSSPITDLFVGNSLMVAGFEVGAFERARPGCRALNIGLGSSSPAEHSILARRAMQLGPDRVYYGFFDVQLFERMQGGWKDLVGNRSMAYYLDLDAAVRYYAVDDPLRGFGMELMSRVPMIVERSTIWGRVEKLRRRIGGIGQRPQPTNRFGRVEDFRSLEFMDDVEFGRACRSIVDGHAGFTPPVLDMLRFSRNLGSSFVVVEMPMPSSHRRRFYDHPEWARLRRHAKDLVRREGGVYLVASDWIGDEGFSDPLHLNALGATEFTSRIATTELARPDGP